MSREFNQEAIAEAIADTLASALEEAGSDLRADYNDYLGAIARDTAEAAIRAAAFPDRRVAVVDLAHLSVQADMIATMVAIREVARVKKIVTDVVLTSARVLGKALAAALVA